MSTAQTSPLKSFRKQGRKMSAAAFGKLFSPPYHKTTILRWEKKGVPLDNVVLVEEVTGIPREQLRPDVFAKHAEARSQ